MQIFRCKQCLKLPYISSSYIDNTYKAQVKCECSNNSEIFISTDSKTSINAAIASWNENEGISYEDFIKNYRKQF